MRTPIISLVPALLLAIAGCDDGGATCQNHFTGTLAQVDNGLWGGTIASDGRSPGWWLEGARLDLEYIPPGNDPVGGQLYGGAAGGGYDEEGD